MPKSLILITVDCLRSDHVGFLGYGRPTTPVLDRVAADSCVFSQAIVAGAPTYYSFPAILASRYPLALGRDVVGLAPDEASLASILRSAGYTTAAFNAGNPYLSARFGYDEGFQVFRDFLDPSVKSVQPANTPQWNALTLWNERASKVARGLGLGSVYDELYFQYTQKLRTREPKSFDHLRQFPAADVIVDNASSWLKTVGGRPFFLWLHMMDPHGPYYPPQESLNVMGDGSIDPRRALYLNHYWNRRELASRRLQRYRDAMVRLYDAGIRWVDLQIQRLIAAVKAIGAWEQCVFTFTADHGEEFLEHGGRFHPQWSGKEELVHVPLFIRFPQERATRTDQVFSQLDLAPTLLEAMGVAVPSQVQGRSRLENLRTGQSWGDPAIVDCTEAMNPSRPNDRLRSRVLCIREQRYKLIMRFGSGSEELYDLDSDPHEQRPIPPAEYKAERRRLLEHARVHLMPPLSGERMQNQLLARTRNFRMEPHGEVQ